ncbi:TPA: hypothetical protein NY226_004618 [Escherichia coli]|nr:hypothetical protein [Escherichia coli]HCL9518748.1 hypothetical protein [Escherichia coli]
MQHVKVVIIQIGGRRAGLGVTTGNRGKISEEDTTETPMYVNRGGRLTILQEDQGQLLTLAGEPDGKLRAAGR